MCLSSLIRLDSDPSGSRALIGLSTVKLFVKLRECRCWTRFYFYPAYVLHYYPSIEQWPLLTIIIIAAAIRNDIRV